MKVKNRPVLSRALLAAAIAGVGVANSAQATSATWKTATSANWITPARWSTNPNYPNNGTPAGSTYDAVIGTTGATYTVTLNSDITVNSLILNAASATLNQTDHTFQAVNGLNIQSGTFQLNGGTILSTKISSSGGKLAAIFGSLDGVTLDADFVANNANIGIYSGLTFNNRTITMSATGNGAYSTLGISDVDESFTGTGTVVFAGGFNQITGTGVLTLGSGITLRSSGGDGTLYAAGLINNGTVSAQSPGQTIQLSPGTFTNNGTLAATAGRLFLGGTITNNGTIIANGGTVTLGGTINTGSLGSYNATGGTVKLSGNLLNSGTTLNLSGPSHTIYLNGGTISGGTVTTSAGGSLGVNFGILDGVTLDTDVSVLNANLGIYNGLTFNNRTITMSATGNGAYSTLGISDVDESFTGTGSIVFDAGFNSITGNGVLTVGSGITLRTGGGEGTFYVPGLINNGTISEQTAGQRIQLPATLFTNNGTVAVSNGGTIELGVISNYSNGSLTGGHYYAFANSSISLAAGSITTNAADVRLDGANSHFDAINSLATNRGTFTVANGRAFSFAGVLNNTSTGDIVAAAGGSIGINGGTNTGTIESQVGGTIVFNGSFNHAVGSYLRGAGSILFNGGTQSFNGTITGDFDLTLNGAAQFGAQSITNTTRALNIVSGGGSIAAGAQIGVGSINFLSGNSPGLALLTGVSPTRLTVSGDVTVAAVTGASQILTVGTGADSILDLGGGDRTFTINNNNATPDLLIAATVTNGAITKSGPGMLALTHSNSFAGGVTLSNGTLQVSDPAALGIGQFVKFNGGTLDLRSDAASSNYPYFFRALAPSQFINLGRITSGAPGRFVVSQESLISNLTVTGAGTLEIGTMVIGNSVIENFTPVEISGPISGLITSLTRGGSGNSISTLTLSGSQPNTYVGLTTLNNGTLLLNKSAGNAIPGNLTIAAGTVRLLANNQISDTSTVSITSPGVFDSGMYNDTLGGFTGNNGTVQGSGELTLTKTTNWSAGAMTGTGTTSIAAGATANFGQLDLERTLNNSGAFNLSDPFEVTTINGYVFNNLAGGVMTASGTNPFRGANPGHLTTFTNTGTFTRLTGGGTTFTRQYTSGTFNFSNSGTIIISGGSLATNVTSASNSGTINVNAGSMALIGVSGFNSGTINVAAGAGLELGNINLLPGSMVQGAGSITLSGTQSVAAGALNPSGAVYLPGNTTFNGDETFSALNLTGTVTGSGNIAVNNSFSENNASLSGPGATTFAPGAIATFSGSADLERTINNGGTINLDPAFSELTTFNGYTINNVATGVINASGLIFIRGGVPGHTSTINNAGVFSVQSGAANLVKQYSSGTLNFANTGAINITGGSLNFSIDSLTNSGRINISGGLLATSTLSNTGTISLTQGLLRYNTDFGNAGTINLSGGNFSGGSVIIDYPGTSPLAAIAAQITTGFAGGAWSGPGINSAAAAVAAGRRMEIGYAEASTLGLNAYAGQSIDGTTVLLRYTYSGDADLSGVVAMNDFTMLSSHFNGAGLLWTDGDFNYDGKVNALDFNALAANFGSPAFGVPLFTPVDAGSPLGNLVPEPAAIALAAMAVMAMGRRRGR